MHNIKTNISYTRIIGRKPHRYHRVVCECGKSYEGTNSGMVAGFIADHDERLIHMRGVLER